MTQTSKAPGRHFDSVWKARVHAMAVQLSERGVFSWSDWTRILGEEIRIAESQPESADQDAYYLAWQRALLRILVSSNTIEETEFKRFYDAWGAAYRRTPHGKPIELSPGDFDASPNSSAA